MSHFISETIQDKAIVSVECEQETVPNCRMLPFSMTFSDLEWLSEIFNDTKLSVSCPFAMFESCCMFCTALSNWASARTDYSTCVWLASVTSVVCLSVSNALELWANNRFTSPEGLGIWRTKQRKYIHNRFPRWVCRRGMRNNRDFPPISHFISETVRDTAIDTNSNLHTLYSTV